MKSAPAVEARYAMSDGAAIAYHVIGDRPRDLVFVPGLVSHLEVEWEHPAYRGFFDRLAGVARVIRFDKRGTGLSDRSPESRSPSLEQRMDDMHAVLDDLGTERASLIGMADGGILAAVFAATHPDRTERLIIYAAEAFDPDRPRAEQLAAWAETSKQEWGSEVQARRSLQTFAPSVADDPRWIAWEGRVTSSAASPDVYDRLVRMNVELDARSALAAVRVPTLVLHRSGDRAVPVERGRALAETIEGARFVELAGDDHYPWVGDSDGLLEEVQAFLGVSDDAPQVARVLTTVVLTEIVDAKAWALELGEEPWRDLVSRHDELMRAALVRHDGRAIREGSDGLVAIFDGPERALRFATTAREALAELGLEIRTGVHTGEGEIRETGLSGTAIHVASRLAAVAQPGEILLTSDVRDLLAGADLELSDRGEQQLHDLPDTWRIFALTDPVA